MTEPTTPRRGKDFLIGFIPSLILALVSLAFLFIQEELTIPFFAGIGLVVAMVVAFIRLRPFIALGILAVLVATPLLLIGSCFAFTP